MSKKRYMIIGVLVVAVILLAFFISSSNPSEKVPVKADFAGICAHWLSADEARLVKESGAGWIRVDASENFSEAVVNARAQNLSVLGILGSGMFNCSMNFLLTDWQNNVTDYISKYAGYVDAWEIWNEPSSLKYPLPATKYFEMARIASPIIRQYDPSAKILLFGGFHLFSDGSPNLETDKAYARQLAKWNITTYGDVISVHAYTWGNNESVVWEKYTESLSFYRSLFGPLEVWVTETGKPLEEGNETISAQYLSDAYRFFSEETDVAKVFWYLLSDYSYDNASFGLTINNLTRPAYGELQKITNSTG